jgi:Cysteine-rich CPCC
MRDSTCPCCGYITLSERGIYEICSICFWEDDPVQFQDADFQGGANKASLRQAQQNFIRFGACEEGMISYVRKPTSQEQKDPDWRLI